MRLTLISEPDHGTFPTPHGRRGLLLPPRRIAATPPRRHDEADEAADEGAQPRRRRALVTPSPYLTITTETDAAESVVHARGELDVSTVLPFREAAFAAIGLTPPLLRLDLTGITAIDSAGITALVTITRVAGIVKIPVEVVPSPVLRELLETTGLTQHMPVSTL